MLSAAEVLAHQGGWDEALMALTPVALFWLLLRAAKARAAERSDESESSAPLDDGHRERHLAR